MAYFISDGAKCVNPHGGKMREKQNQARRIKQDGSRARPVFTALHPRCDCPQTKPEPKQEVQDPEKKYAVVEEKKRQPGPRG
jgi:hypothetical protein